MGFIVSDIEERRYFSHDEKTHEQKIVSKQFQAFIFPTRQKAENTIENSLKYKYAKLGIVWKIIEVDEEKDSNKDMESSLQKILNEQNNQANYQVDYIEAMATLEETPVSGEPININLRKILETILIIAPELEKEKQRVCNKQIKVCKALTDLNHHRLLSPHISASERCKRDTATTKLILKRQELKDEIFYIEFLEKLITDADPIAAKYETFKQKGYIPREFPELFEENVIPNIDEWLNNI